MGFSLPLHRRQFLRGAAAFGLSQGLFGCASSSLEVKFLKNSIPLQLINRFRQEFPQQPAIAFESSAQLKDLWQQLKTKSSSQQLITIGNTSLKTAIAENLIQPLDPKDWSHWPNLAPRWQSLVRRDRQGLTAPQGEIWGAPYRWGTTMIVYWRDKFEDLGWTPQTWDDLWRQELQNRVAMVDQPREVIGLTLKKLGYSYNEAEPQRLAELMPALEQLRSQVKFFSSRHYLQSLLLKDTWLAVGWSNEILPLLKSEPRLAAVIPRNGTALWADLWVSPTKLTSTSSLSDWLNFMWQAESANQISLFSHGASPRLETMDSTAIMPAVAKNSLINLPGALLDRCEFIQPLSAQSEQAYLKIWETLAQA